MDVLISSKGKETSYANAGSIDAAIKRFRNDHENDVIDAVYIFDSKNDTPETRVKVDDWKDVQ